MIDPIGLVGTLIAIIQVSNKIVSVCYEYRNGVRNASREISQILAEVASVGDIAQRLLKTAESDYSADLPSLQSLTGDDSTLRKCLDELIDLKAGLKQGKSGGLKSALVWPWKRPEVEKRVQVIERVKLTLQLALSADNAQNMVEVLAQSRLLPLIHKQVSSLTEHREQSAKDDARKEFLRLLAGRDQSAKHRQEYQKFVQGTGTWLLEHQDYVDWKLSAGKILWLNGMAGCGKSVLCSRVIEDLRAHCDRDEFSNVCYFYLDGSDQRSLDVESLYRSLLSQLVSQQTTPFQSWSFSSRRRLGSVVEDEPIPLAKWRADLKYVLGQVDHGFVVLDALDEFDDLTEPGLDEIITFIRDVMDAASNTTHVIVFSRDLERLRIHFGDLNAKPIHIDGEALNSDLRTALRHRFSKQPKFARWPPSVKKSVETSLLSQANGSFRWLECQLQALQRCATPVALKKVLSDLPKSLEAYYARVLENIDDSNRVSVKHLLRWIVFAQRPLSLTEVASAMTINADGTDVPFVDEYLELFDPDGFVDSLSSLVSTYRDIQDSTGCEVVYVKVAHFTVREFLTSQAARIDSCLFFAMDAELTHACLAKSCLAYFHQFVQSPVDNEAPNLGSLASYAGYFWFRHKSQSGKEDQTFETSLLSTLADLFDEEKPFFRNWLQACNIDRPWLGEGSEKSTDYSPLYCAAYYGLARVVEALLNKGVSPNQPGGLYGTPLQAAASNGNLLLVKTLLSAGADVDADGGVFDSALGAASAKGHIEVAEALIEAGASLGYSKIEWSRSGGRYDPLYLSVVNGHLAVCELLLDHGARDYYHMKGMPPSAVQAAASSGRIDILRALLRRDRIRDANGPGAGSAGVIRLARNGINASQHRAAALGHIDVLRELLAYGISEEEALRYAARAGDETLVLQYLDQGVQIDSTGESSDHPRALQSAAKGGHLSLVRELLSRGADLNLESSYSTAIADAISGGNIEVVQLLIEAGAEVKSPRERLVDRAFRAGRRDIAELLVQYGSDTHGALISAVIRADSRIFRHLIDLGADIHRQEPEDKTSLLAAAAWGGSALIVRYLLENGLLRQLNPCPEVTTPLMEAVHTRRWPVVQLLLDFGADVNAPPPLTSEPRSRGGVIYDGHIWPPRPAYETPLTSAVREKNPDIARLLISHGALTTPTTPTTAGTPLLYAVWEGFGELIQELLRDGADANQRGTVLKRGKPTFPLLLAAERGDVGIIGDLIAAGARVDDQDDEGFSALHAAAASEKPDALVAVLQDHGASLNVRLMNGSQPIHSAASRGSARHVEILLDAGAPIDGRNNTGRTPLHWAAENGNWETVEYLLDRGAEAGAEADEVGAVTPLDMASVARGELRWRSAAERKGWEAEGVDKLLERLKGAATK